MFFGQKHTFKFKDTTAGKAMQPVTLNGTTEDEIILADTTDDPIIGVLAEDAADGDYVGVYVFGWILEVPTTSGAVAVGDKVGITAEGQVATIARTTTYQASATMKYMLGIALQANGSVANKMIKVLAQPMPIETTS